MICATRSRAVLRGHVPDHLVAPALVEVHVDVGHLDPPGVQEPLEDQVVPERIEVGDPQRVRDHRTRGRAPAGPDADAVLAREPDQVPHDQEVAREPHRRDHAELLLDAFEDRSGVSVAVPRPRPLASRARAGRRRGPCPPAARTSGRGTAPPAAPSSRRRARARTSRRSAASRRRPRGARGRPRASPRRSSGRTRPSRTAAGWCPTAASAAGCRAGRRGASRPRAACSGGRSSPRAAGRSGSASSTSLGRISRCSDRPWSWSSMKKFPAPKMSAYVAATSSALAG